MSWTAADHDDTDVLVLLTPRAMGGHELALFAWLNDAVRQLALKPSVHAPGLELRRAAASAGLAPSLRRQVDGTLAGVLRALWGWPADKPLLLAPGVLHAGAWLLALALLLGRRVWVYVPMTNTGVEMGFRAAAWRDRFLRPWLRGVEAWITLDERQAARLRAAWGVQAPVHTLPNPLRHPRAPAAWPAPAADGALRVVYVGRLQAHQKGLDWLIELLRAAPRWTLRCRWCFQGSGPLEDELRRLAAELGGDRVVVRGPAPIGHALEVADVLLLASRFEGQPLVALEATALGWPVVATRSSGVEGLVGDDALYDFGDAEGLRAALQAMRHPAARHRAVERARAQLQAAGLESTYWRGLAEIGWALKKRREGAAHGRRVLR